MPICFRFIHCLFVELIQFNFFIIFFYMNQQYLNLQTLAVLNISLCLIVYRLRNIWESDFIIDHKRIRIKCATDKWNEMNNRLKIWMNDTVIYLNATRIQFFLNCNILEKISNKNEFWMKMYRDTNCLFSATLWMDSYFTIQMDSNFILR